MHSRVIQLEKNPNFNPVTEEYILELGFVDDVADYISEIQGEENRRDSLEWFVGCYGGITLGTEDGKDVIRIASPLDPMETMFNEFKEQVKDLTLDTFCNIGWAIRAKDLINSEPGFYVCRDGYGYDSMTTFFRQLSKESNITLYVGTIFDYHF